MNENYFSNKITHFFKMPIYPEKILCFICNKRLGRERTYKDVCSAKCKREKLNIILPPKHGTGICPVCENTFDRKSSRNIYCSNHCLKKASAEKLILLKGDFSIFNRDNFKCIYCGKSSIEDGIKLHIDHVTAISNNGLTSIENLITSCSGCNTSKNNLELSPDVKKRILNVISIKNKLLTEEELKSVELSIIRYSKFDNQRLSKLVSKKK